MGRNRQRRQRNRNQVRSSVDVNKLATAVSRPGIDPREWLKLMTVMEIGFDAAEGIFADLQDQLSGVEETAYFGSSYAGNGFGMHWPLNVDDTVLVALPGGDPGLGPVIVARWNNSGDPPSVDFRDADDTEDATKDVVLRVEDMKKFRVRTSGDGGDIDIQIEGDGTLLIENKGSGEMRIKQSGSGNIVLEAIGAGKVLLGGDSGGEPTTLATTLTNFLVQVKGWLDSHVHNYIDSISASATATPSVSLIAVSSSPSVPDISADEVESK